MAVEITNQIRSFHHSKAAASSGSAGAHYEHLAHQRSSGRLAQLAHHYSRSNERKPALQYQRWIEAAGGAVLGMSTSQLVDATDEEQLGGYGMLCHCHKRAARCYFAVWGLLLMSGEKFQRVSTYYVLTKAAEVASERRVHTKHSRR